MSNRCSHILAIFNAYMNGVGTGEAGVTAGELQ